MSISQPTGSPSGQPIPLHTGPDLPDAAPILDTGAMPPQPLQPIGLPGSALSSQTGRVLTNPPGQTPGKTQPTGSSSSPAPAPSKTAVTISSVISEPLSGKAPLTAEKREEIAQLKENLQKIDDKRWIAFEEHGSVGKYANLALFAAYPLACIPRYLRNKRQYAQTMVMASYLQSQGVSLPKEYWKIESICRHAMKSLAGHDAASIRSLKTAPQPKPAALQRPVLISVDSFIKGVQAEPYMRSPHMNMCVEALKYRLANRDPLTQTEDDIILDHLEKVSGAKIKDKYSKAEQDEMVAKIKAKLGDPSEYDPAEAARAHLMDKPIDEKAKPSLLECLARMRRGEELPDNPTWNPVKQKVAALSKAKDAADLDTKITAALRELGEKPASEAEAVDQIAALLQAKPIKPQDDKEKLAADADKSKIPETSSFDKVLELADKGFTLSDLQKGDIDNLRGVLTENKGVATPENLVRGFLTLRGDNPLSIDDAAIKRILAHIDKLDKAADAKPPAAASFTSPSVPPDAVIAYGKHAPLLPPGQPFLAVLQHVDAPGWLSAAEGRLFDCLATRMKRAPKGDHPMIIAGFLKTLEESGRIQVSDPAQRDAYAQEVLARMNSLLVRQEGDKASLLDMQRVAKSGGLLTQQQNTTMQAVMQGVRDMQKPTNKAGDAAIYLQQFLQTHGQLPTSRTEAEAMIGDIIKLTNDLDGKPVRIAPPEPPAPSATRTVDKFTEALQLHMDKKPPPRGAAQFQLATLVKTLDQQVASEPSLDAAAIKKIVGQHLLKIGIVSATDAQINDVVSQLGLYKKPTLLEYQAQAATGAIPNTKGWNTKKLEVDGKLKVLQVELDKQLIGPRTIADLRVFNEDAVKVKCMETAFPELTKAAASDRPSLFQAIRALHNMTVTPVVNPPDIPVTPPTQAIPVSGPFLSSAQLSELYEKNIATKMMTEDEEIALFLQRNFTNFPVDAASKKAVIDRVKEQRMQSFEDALQSHVEDPTVHHSVFKPEDLVRHLRVERNDEGLKAMIIAHFKDCGINPEDEVVKGHIQKIQAFLRDNVCAPPGGPTRQPTYLQFLEHAQKYRDSSGDPLPDLPGWRAKQEALDDLQAQRVEVRKSGVLSDDEIIREALQLSGDANDDKIIELVKDLYPLPVAPKRADGSFVSTFEILHGLVVEKKPLPNDKEWRDKIGELLLLPMKIRLAALSTPTQAEAEKNVIRQYLEERGELSGKDDDDQLIADVIDLVNRLPEVKPAEVAKAEEEEEVVEEEIVLRVLTPDIGKPAASENEFIKALTSFGRPGGSAITNAQLLQMQELQERLKKDNSDKTIEDYLNEIKHPLPADKGRREEAIAEIRKNYASGKIKPPSAASDAFAVDV